MRSKMNEYDSDDAQAQIVAHTDPEDGSYL